MGHTPFGYRIEGGKAVVDEVAAGQIRKLYENYLSGLSLENAAKEAGIKTYHGTVKKLLSNSGGSLYRLYRKSPGVDHGRHLCR